MRGLDRLPGAQDANPKATLPEHLSCTTTMAGPSVVCLGTVRSGAAIGQRLDGGGTAEVHTLGQRGQRKHARALTVRGPSGTPTATPNRTSAAVDLLGTANERERPPCGLAYCAGELEGHFTARRHPPKRVDFGRQPWPRKNGLTIPISPAGRCTNRWYVSLSHAGGLWCGLYVVRT